MKSRLIDTDTDYPVISRWWEGHGFPVIPAAFLPKLGVVIECDEGPICAGWIYMDTSSPVTWLEWVVTNPRNRPTLSLVALKALIGAAKEAVMAVRSDLPGSAAMLFTCRQPALARLFEKEGFERTDSEVMHMLSIIEKPQPVEANS